MTEDARQAAIAALVEKRFAKASEDLKALAAECAAEMMTTGFSCSRVSFVDGEMCVERVDLLGRGE